MKVWFAGFVGVSCVCAIGCSTTSRSMLENSPVIISELHFHPSDGQGSAEFIEIANMTTEPVDLSGWEVTGAGRTAIPAGTTVAAGETVVLCKHQPTLERIGNVALQHPVPFDGKLKNKGETVRIEDPQGRIADEVEYDNDRPEAAAADGTGNSLHRVRFTAGEGEELWRAGPPTPGRFKAADVAGLEQASR